MVTFHAISSRIVSEIKGFPSAFSSGNRSEPHRQINLEDASQRATSRPFVDAIVLSGGEPLLQLEASRRLFRLARSLKLATGLETSGCFPDNLEILLADELVDKLFLDLKTSLLDSDYEKATGRAGMASLAAKSLAISFKSKVALDIRCTIFPDAPSISQLLHIADTLCCLKAQYPGNRMESLILQQGMPRDGETRFEPVSIEALQEMAKSCEMRCQSELPVRIRATPNITWKN